MTVVKNHGDSEVPSGGQDFRVFSKFLPAVENMLTNSTFIEQGSQIEEKNNNNNNNKTKIQTR
jgi:hypothetical protein